jgi:CheY-like chemotaxis protein
VESYRILIVDDDQNLCELMREVAVSVGYAARATTDPEEFKVLYDDKIDLVVLDLVMPGTDGMQLMRFLAQQPRKARVILVSGTEQRVLQTATDLAVELGLSVVSCLPKPFRVRQFSDLLRQQLPPAETGS